LLTRLNRSVWNYFFDQKDERKVDE